MPPRSVTIEGIMAKTNGHLKLEKFGSGYSGLRLHGDPKRPEQDQIGIKFPGGEVFVTRCTDGTYWAHIEAERQWDIDLPEYGETIGELVEERRDTTHEVYGAKFYHFAAKFKRPTDPAATARDHKQALDKARGVETL